MRIGALGDIHGNALALTAALAGAARENVEALCLTGDYVGYYYRPDEVLALLEPWPKYMVRGNHEDMLLRAESEPDFLDKCTARYGHGLSKALSILSSKQLDLLRELPRRLDLNFSGCRVCLAHGAPWDTDTYIYPDTPDAIMKKVASGGEHYVLLGHTHYSFVRVVNNTTIINPGAVGQPRDRKPGAAWALLDTESGDVRLYTEPYDISAVANEAFRVDPQIPYLREILNRR